VINYLGSLAVHVPDPENPDPSVDRDLFGFDEIVAHLDLSRIGPSGKIVDLDRLNWINGQYIRRLSIAEFGDRVRPFMEAAGFGDVDQQKLAAALPLEQERIKRLSEAPEVLSFFFRDEPYEPRLLIPKGVDKERTLEILQSARQAVEVVAAEDPRWSADALKDALWPLAQQLGVKPGQMFGAGAIRVAVTCRIVGPPIFESMEILGPETVKRRLNLAIEKLVAYQAT
jgi:glutamyl-tRNA synthetase